MDNYEIRFQKLIVLEAPRDYIIDACRQLVSDGRKLSAIKLIRAHIQHEYPNIIEHNGTHVFGLKEAKDYIEDKFDV